MAENKEKVTKVEEKSLSQKIKEDKAKKKKKKDLRAAKGAAKPNRSFEQMTAEANRKALEPYIAQLIGHYFQVIKNSLTQELDGLYLRLTALEKIAMDKFDMSADDLSDMIADIEDELSGLDKVEDGECVNGDVVRIEISTKLKKDEKEDYKGSTKYVLENLANPPFAIAKEVEDSILGMKVGDVKETAFGKGDAEVVAKIAIDRISRAPKVEETVEEVKEDANENKDAK